MKNLVIGEVSRISNKKALDEIDMIDFYNEATEDYAFWSNDFNMHFGYFNPSRTNPFKRDQMLNEMNRQVLKRLNIGGTSLLIDLGCGMGATLRYALKRNKNLSTIGITLSDVQVREGNKLLKDLRGIILQENYNNTSLPSDSSDAVVAIESFCHSGHKRSSLKEAHRILRPGGRVVIADAFLKKDPNELCYGSLFAYKNLCNHWSLPKLGTIQETVNTLKGVGFKKVKAEEISFAIAPSVLHVPFAIIGFIVKKLRKKRTLKKESLHNLKGSFYALLSGLHMRSFGYYLITCQK